MQCTLVPLENGAVEVRYSASVAGTYRLSVTHVSGSALPGGPFAVEVSTASAAVGHSEANLAGGMSRITAGAVLEVMVEPKDTFGNPVVGLDPGRMGLAAMLPDGQAVQLVFDRGEGNVHVFKAALETAGTYTVQVLVEGKGICGWPRMVHVTAAAVAPSRTQVGGSALARPLVCGTPSQVVVQTMDAFGNACTKGGADLEVVLLEGGGKAREVGVVTDCNDGTYAVDVVVDRAGDWRLEVTVGGEAVRTGGFKVASMFGPPTAKDCSVTKSVTKAICGRTDTVQVQAGTAGPVRALDGTEGLSMDLNTPSGATQKVDVVLREDGAYAEWAVEWVEAGKHTLNVTLGREHVKGSPIVVEAVAEQVCLAKSALSGEGLTSAVAGERAIVIVEAKDVKGNRMHVGGTKMSVEGPVGTLQAGGVECMGHGQYHAWYIVTKAGDYAINVVVEDTKERFSLRGRCLPGRTDVEKCVIQGGGETVVGQKGTVRIVCCDHYGNPISAHVEGDVRFRAESSRPGSMTTTLQERPGGATEVSFPSPFPSPFALHLHPASTTCSLITPCTRLDAEVIPDRCERRLLTPPLFPHPQVTYEASVAGEYTISLSCAETGTMVPGSPRTVLILPDEVHAAMCEATVTKTAGTAGETLAVQVELRDKFGNPLPDNTQGLPEVTVVAHGSSEVVLTPTGTGLVFEAAMKQAGSYVVQALVAGKSVRGWPRIEQIAPAAVAPGKTQVGGSALARPLVCGTPSQMVVQTMDAFGNACTKGGADLEVVLVLEGGDGSDKDLKPVAGVVTDCKDGTYAVDVVVDRAGDWRLEVTVGGEAVRAGGFKVASMFGPPTAKDCSVTKSVTKAVCGRTDTVQVRAGGAGGSRSFSDTEGLGMNMVAPSGVSHKVDLEFREDGAYAEWAVEWVEAGKHTLNVTLGGVHVKGSPIVVEAEAEEICLANSAIGGPGLLDAVAGERAIVTIEAKDVKGNRMVTKETKMSIEGAAGTVQAGGVECTGPGQYKAWFVVTKAGPYEVDIVVEDTKERFSICGRCVAGRTDVEKCVLHGSESYVVAGQKGSLQVVRYDKAGNLVTNAAGDVEIRVNCSGPGQMGHVLLERDQGGLEVQYSATAEGTYTLTLTSGETGAQLKGAHVH
jgi:uncharacterized protein (DUF2141 family)